MQPLWKYELSLQQLRSELYGGKKPSVMYVVQVQSAVIPLLSEIQQLSMNLRENFSFHF